jgi:hypothetical protein
MKDLAVNHIDSVRNFFTNAPLYEQFKMVIGESDDESHGYLDVYISDAQSPAHLIYGFTENIRLFCPTCGMESSFASERMPAPGSFSDDKRRIVKVGRGFGEDRLQVFQKTFICTHDKQTPPTVSFTVLFSESEKWIMKIGQWPSHADIQTELLSEYNTVFEQGEKPLIQKGLGLATHGAHLGAFAYFRRFLENLVNKAHDKMGKPEDDWYKLRFREKIEVVKDELPEEMDDLLKPLYGRLSEGIHALSEKECAGMLEAVFGAIVILLEERLAIKKKKDRHLKVKAALQKVN